ncbi:MAG: hypothetical protein IH605_14325 [Burkholderiales bacterium]|nr:hypothetical protein [Burkholderiales bacterium]
MKPAIFAVVAALAGTAAFSNLPANPRNEQAQESVSLKVIDNFLDDSRRYLGL